MLTITGGLGEAPGELRRLERVKVLFRLYEVVYAR